MPSLFNGPILLQPTRFTPLSKTPWAGNNIGLKFKSEFISNPGELCIGEAWEFSCDPSFPSLLQSSGQSLIDLVEQFPVEILSAPLREKTGDFCEILLKLIDAAQPLSLQVHPSDDDPSLKPGECGKPESWLVLDAKPGAGMYLGFSQAISRENLREALLDGAKAKELLHFVPAHPGDYFEIQPGVPHAIGPGVTLLEPQRIARGKSGKTYRLWDWGRKYNADGHLDLENGQGRELHLEIGMRLINPELQVGDKFVATTRRRPLQMRHANTAIELEAFPPSPYYQLQILRVKSDTHIATNIQDGYGVLTVLAGSCRAKNSPAAMTPIQTGMTALLPAAAKAIEWELQAGALIAIIIPSASHLEVI